jgi:hypothetical protein
LFSVDGAPLVVRLFFWRGTVMVRGVKDHNTSSLKFRADNMIMNMCSQAAAGMFDFRRVAVLSGAPHDGVLENGESGDDRVEPG